MQRQSENGPQGAPPYSNRRLDLLPPGFALQFCSWNIVEAVGPDVTARGPRVCSLDSRMNALADRRRELVEVPDIRLQVRLQYTQTNNVLRADVP